MDQPSVRVSAASRWLDHAFLPLLVAVYVAATLAPAPRWLDRLPLPEWLGGRGEAPSPSAAKLILAGLLFVAGLRLAVPAWPKAPLRAAGMLALAAGARLVPLAAMIGLTRLLMAAAAPPFAIDVATGLLLVAAVPSANTSTAWTRRSGGSLTLCVGVLLLTTLAAPVVVPTAASLAAGPDSAMTAADDQAFAAVGLNLLGWVVLPMAAGMLAGRLSGARAGVSLGSAGSAGALVAILALNYLNASRGLPQLLDEGQLLPLAASAATGATLVGVSYAGAGLIARIARLSPEAGLAVVYAVGMSNTGLAGTLANMAFPDRAVILYPIVLCTLAQHVMAALIDGARRRTDATAVSGAAARQPRSTAPGRVAR